MAKQPFKSKEKGPSQKHVTSDEVRAEFWVDGEPYLGRSVKQDVVFSKDARDWKKFKAQLPNTENKNL